MNKPKSAVSWMRKQLGVKGKTLHNGRGVFECFTDLSDKEVLSIAKTKLEEWKEVDLVEEVNEDENWLVVKLKDIFSDKFYRTFSFPKTKPAWMNANKNYYACLFSI